MDPRDIESALQENRRFPPPAAFVARARLRPQELEAMRRKASSDHLGFWADLARKSLYWHKPFTVTLDDSKAPNYRWFPDGELNVSWNCLDVHLEARGDKTAVIFEGESGDVRRLSYRELHGEVCRLANALKQLGIGRGDRVVIYMPMVPEAVIAMQACARIGAVHSVVFGGFSFNSIRDRIEDAGARLVITADGGRRGGHVIELKSAVDKALAGSCPSIEKVIVLKGSGVPVTMRAGRDLWWSELTEKLSADCPPEWVD
ncbi:MAG TPA: AMP-binding protein, partial [Steroidobacteraceae bacterium]|nr:AMP-binding protein [Steroidobacteraceae bacterium]